MESMSLFYHMGIIFFSDPLRRLFANGGRGNFCLKKKKKLPIEEDRA
jgi:hypothetical protein